MPILNSFRIQVLKIKYLEHSAHTEQRLGFATYADEE
jgi:hypothetical protein